MINHNSFPSQINHDIHPPLAEGLEGVEIEHFPSPDKATEWIHDTIPRLSGVNEEQLLSSDKDWGYPPRRTFKADNLIEQGIDLQYTQETYPVGPNFSLTFEDGAGGIWSVEGAQPHSHDGDEPPLDTKISYTTPSGTGMTPYSRAVTRSEQTEGQREQHGKVEAYYSLETNIDSMPNLLTTEEYTNPMKGKGAFTEEESEEAGRLFVELSSGFQRALESKMAVAQPGRLKEIESLLEKQRKGSFAKMLGRLGLSR